MYCGPARNDLKTNGLLTTMVESFQGARPVDGGGHLVTCLAGHLHYKVFLSKGVHVA